jgi:hypothetical protein
MSLKTRLKNLESSTQPKHEDMCLFIVGAYPAGKTKPPIIGYCSDGIRVMRFENEHDDDLQARAKSTVLEQTTRQDCGLKFAMIHEIFDD